MRFFKTFFTLAAFVCAGLLVACENDPTTKDEPKRDIPVINISNTTMEVAAEGGDYTIELSVTNAIGDIKVAAKSEAEWLSVKETSTTAVVFNASFNNEESSRSTTLTIKYPEADEVVVNITQAGKSGEPFTIEIKDVTYNKFISTITAQNPENYYVSYMSTVSYFHEMGIADEEALLLDDYNYFAKHAMAYGYELCDFMVDFGVAYQGSTHIERNCLVPAESYVVYAYGVKFNEDGSDYTVTTPVYYEVVETPMNELGSISFMPITSVDGPKVALTMKPIDYDGYYTYLICDSSHKLFHPQYEGLTDEYFIRVAQYWMSQVNSPLTYDNKSAEEILQERCYKGIYTLEETLLANSDYLILIMPIGIVDGLPMLISAPNMIYITTGDVQDSEMTFDIEVNKCYTSVLDYTITPSTNESYTHIVLKKSELEEYTTDEDIINYAINGYWLDESYGLDSYHYSLLQPDTEYSIIAFGYYGGVATTGLTRIDIKTEPVAPAENSVTGIVTYGPYDLAAVAELDPSLSYLASYDNHAYFVMLHWLETDSPDYEMVYHYIYDTALIELYGDEWIYEDLIAYTYTPIRMDAGAFNTEYVIAGVVQDYRGNYSEMVYSEPFTYSADQYRDTQEFLDLYYGNTRSGKVQMSLVGRDEIINIPMKK